MIPGEINNYRIILASHSPRRQELLKELGLKFSVVVKNWTETYPPELKRENIALYVAVEKARSFKPSIKENEIVITADTIVWCNDRVLDKPVDPSDAKRIL